MKAMCTLVAVVFDDETTAFEMRAALVKMQQQHLIELEDSVVVKRNEKGNIKLGQAVNLTKAGAVGGGFWGVLIGLLFLNPLLGAAIGATAGALSAQFKDLGLNDQMMPDLRNRSNPARRDYSFSCAGLSPTKCSNGLKAFAGRGRIFQMVQFIARLGAQLDVDIILFAESAEDTRIEDAT
jgi:uncharacterized membrane protein